MLLKQQNQPLRSFFRPQARCHHPVKLAGVAGAGSLEKGSLTAYHGYHSGINFPACSLPVFPSTRPIATTTLAVFICQISQVF